MAVTRTKKDNLVETKIVEEKNKDLTGDNLKKEAKFQTKEPKKKKIGFLQSTWAEVKLAKWPKFGYVAKWAFVIIIFTAVFSIVIGSFDFLFTQSVKVVDCTSAKSRNRPFSECSQEFVDYMTFKK